MEPWILVIDDDAGTREALEAILRRAGYRVTSMVADTALEAACAEQHYQVAVVDYHLPGASGLDAARRLKQLQPDCKVILISSEFPLAVETRPTAVVDHFLAKPFSKDAILEVIAQLCPAGAP